VPTPDAIPPAGRDAGGAGDAEPASLARLARHAPALAAAAAGLAWFLLHVPASLLDPAAIGWLYERDWVAGQLGWSFYRTAPWLGVPLGENPLYPFPVGSTLGASDSVPLLGVLLRPFASLLPADFQYLGPWMALCFALQGFAGAKLARLATPSRTAQGLAGALFAVAPPLLHRCVGPGTHHAALCAHFLLLAFLWLALAPAPPGPVRRRLAMALLLLAVSGGVQPYFTAMGAALVLALVARHVAVDRRLRAHEGAGWAAAAVLVAAAGIALFGFVGRRASVPTFGFGVFSADALTLVNPMGWSRLWAGLPVAGGQYEGFAYLGAGGLLLAAATLAIVALRPPGLRSAVRAAAPAAAAALLLAAFALSDTVTAGGRELFRIGAYDVLSSLTGMLRSCGRFVWPLHYLVLLGGVAGVSAALRARPRALAAVLGATLLLQVSDVRPPVPLDVGEARWRSPLSATWDLARGRYAHLALFPPVLNSGGRFPPGCGPPVWGVLRMIPFADRAYRLGLTFDSAYVARLDEAALNLHCTRVRRELAEGRLDPDTVWVVHRSALPAFRRAGATCGEIDGVPVCVAATRDDPLAAALRASPAP
jgi:hypothetical protein